ncbi:11436_t:CDS:2, partial [Ambispora leptoticha]
PKVRRQRTTQHYIASQKSSLVTSKASIERVVPGSAIAVNAKTLLSSYSKEFAEVNSLAKSNKSDNTSVDRPDSDLPHNQIPKKKKLRDRHVKWLQKLDASYSGYSKHNNKKKRNSKNQTKQKVNIEDPTFDLSSLKQTLETLPDIKSDADKFVPGRNRAPLPKGLNGKKVVGKKARKNVALAEMQLFQKITQNPVFIADPLSTIQAHIQTLRLSDDSLDTDNKSQRK